jgi:hypothetical protein
MQKPTTATRDGRTPSCSTAASTSASRPSPVNVAITGRITSKPSS